MKSAKISSAIFIFSIAICGCRKDALTVNANLVGDWNTINYGPYGGSSFSIASNNEATYTEGTDSKAKKYSGVAKIKNDVLKIGSFKIPITTYPTFDSAGNYYMKLNGGEFIGAWAVLSPTAFVSGDSVNFVWGNVVSDADFDNVKSIDYRILSATSWTTTNVNVNSYASSGSCQITGLNPATTYEWRMKSVHGLHSSQYSAIQTFTTQ